MSGRYSAFALLHQGFARHQELSASLAQTPSSGVRTGRRKAPADDPVAQVPAIAERRRLVAARRHRAARRSRASQIKGDRVRQRSRPHSLIRPARLAADEGAGRLRPSRHVPGVRPGEADAPMGRNRRRRSGPLPHHRLSANARNLSQLRLGRRRLQGHSRRRHAARICSRLASTTRSAAASIFRVFPPGALSMRPPAPASRAERDTIALNP